MKKLAVLGFVLLVAAPVFAGIDLTAWASWVKPQSNNTFNSTTANQPFNINFRGKLGYGAGVNLRFSTLALAFDAVEVRPDARYGFPGATLNQGNLRIVPITAILQWHPIGKAFVDPYVGAGAAYILLHNITGVSDVGHVGVNQINFKSDAGLALNGGLGINFSRSIGLTGDVKYVPLKSSATAVFTSGPNQSQRIKINPVIASAGLTFHF